MKKIILQLFTTVLVMNVFCQTETFDIASFVAPQGWERKDSLGTILFHDYKTENGMTRFCQLFMYRSRASKNSPEKNFQEEWSNRVIKTTGTKQKPKITSEKNPDGWTAVTGVANITRQGVTYTCMLVAASGFGKVMSVLINVAGEDYMPVVEKFFNDLDLDAKRPIATNNPVNKPNVTENKTVSTASQAMQSFGLIQYSPPANWIFSENPGAKQYMYNDQSNNAYCVITIYDAANSRGTQQSDFSEEWNSKVLSIGSGQAMPKTQSNDPSTQPNFIQGSNLMTMKNGGGSFFIRLLVLRMDNFRQAISFASATEQSLNIYSNTIASFTSSIQRNAAMNNNTVTTTPVQNNGNTGSSNQFSGSNSGSFYYGMQAGSNGFEYGNSKHYLYLSPSGSFRYGYSQEGYYNYSTEIDRQRTPDFAGTYTNSGGAIRLNFYSGRTMQFNTNGKDLDGSNYRFVRFPQINGKTFEGTYVKADLIRDLWPNGIQPKAMLHGNGRFEDQGLFGFGETVDPSLPFQEWKERTANLGKWGNGSYAIMDNSLLLSYDDGRRKQLLIYIYQEDANRASPKLIVLGGQSLTLQ